MSKELVREQIQNKPTPLSQLGDTLIKDEPYSTTLYSVNGASIKMVVKHRATEGILRSERPVVADVLYLAWLDGYCLHVGFNLKDATDKLAAAVADTTGAYLKG